MAVGMTSGEEKKPTFHDFFGRVARSGEKKNPLEAEPEISASLGATSGGHGLVSGSSDLGSERQGVNNSEVFHFHGRKASMSGPEVGNTFSGRKRTNSDSAYLGMMADRMLPVSSDSLEGSRIMKMFGKEVISEQSGRSQEDEITFSMQPPQRPGSLMLRPPAGSRPESPILRLERTVPSSGQMVYYPSRFAQSGTYMDKVSSSSYRCGNASMGATLVSQSAADEGSRTGVKGSGVLKIIDPNSGVGERNLIGLMPCSSKPKVTQMIEPESSNVPSRHTTMSVGRQMTIFYAGQAHVFDNVHPNKADLIMALAGSNGGSWSTTYSLKSDARPSNTEAKVPSKEGQMRIGSLPALAHGLSEATPSRVLMIADPNDLSGPLPGVLQDSVTTRDARPSIPSAQFHMEGKRDA
ncbi:protein TIFY 8 isoform X1 [Typha latifolia]|uniref:protein TIFY 8 isoform X1 n=1 Tax=Typha latifolia TaxID=4733 RepID=UPI003C301E23